VPCSPGTWHQAQALAAFLRERAALTRTPLQSLSASGIAAAANHARSRRRRGPSRARSPAHRQSRRTLQAGRMAEQFFLDEVVNFRSTPQVKLCAYCRNRSSSRIGTSKTIKVNVRASSGHESRLEEWCARENSGRSILPLNVVPLRMPACANARGIHLLTMFFVAEVREEARQTDYSVEARGHAPALELIVAG